MREVGPQRTRKTERILVAFEEWPEFLKTVVEEINSEQGGFNFRVSYDKVGNFYVLESPDDFYVHIEIHKDILKIRNIFAIQKGNGYGKMIMNKIIEITKKRKDFGINKIIADNVSPTEVARNFWKDLKFKWSRENALNMELNV